MYKNLFKYRTLRLLNSLHHVSMLLRNYKVFNHINIIFVGFFFYQMEITHCFTE